MAEPKNIDPELVTCSFKCHNILTIVGDIKISCQIIKMKDSYYIWVGDIVDSVMNDLSLALISDYEKVPISTKLMGSAIDSTSINMAARLATKLGKPVYISFNIKTDKLSIPAIEKKLSQEISNSLALLEK
ncbi:proteasome assembly chaperone 4 [Neodiprion virginianus]|uniref:proteasome assembly chaperone 4 n=1 Tax=Neodiprion virginianus TaxID=2961670 RepID=UPI001EE72556|nr:proteasome assembly chaperone 4 [Neodiprion virginianus]